MRSLYRSVLNTGVEDASPAREKYPFAEKIVSERG